MALQGVGGHGFDKLTKTTTVAKLLEVRLELPYICTNASSFCHFFREAMPALHYIASTTLETLCELSAICLNQCNCHTQKAPVQLSLTECM